VRYTIVAVTIIAVLQRFGVQTTSLIAVVGAAGLAIGLAIQGTLSNVAAGAMLLALRPFRIGDYIEAGGQGGTVREIGLFTTVMTTADLIYVAMPNSQIFGGTIINYSREPTRRLNFTVGIDYGDDIDKAQAIIVDVLKADSRVLENPAPMAPVGALGASSVDIIVRCWVPTAVYWDALFDLQKAVKQALDAGGITIPFPQQTHSMRPDTVVRTSPASHGAGVTDNTSS
jgi:small conductance mechanosensitive channel